MKVKDDIVKKVVIDDDGIVGATNIVITPDLCVKIGAAIASLGRNISVGVGYNSSGAAKALAYAVMSGVMSAGGTVWNFSETFESQHNFCMAKSVANYGVYIDSGIITTIRLCGLSGVGLMRSEEKKIESLINSGSYRTVNHKMFGKHFSVENIGNMYPFELIKLSDVMLDGIKVNIRCNNPMIRRVIESTLIKLGCDIGDDIIINISQNGKNVAIYSNETGYIFHERVLALVCLSEFLRGNDVAIEESSPIIIDKLAQVHSKNVYRYNCVSTSDKERKAKKKAINQLFLRDAIMLSIKLLCFIKKENITLKEANALIPEFNVLSRYVAISLSPQLIRNKLKLNEPDKVDEIININVDKGNVSIKQIKSGRGLMILAESVNTETAQEMCDFFENVLTNELPS